MDEQDDFDSACFQQSLEERRQREPNSGIMDPRLFAEPLRPWPRLTSKEAFDADMESLRALSFAMGRLFE